MVTLARRVLVPTAVLGGVLVAAVGALAWDAVRTSGELERRAADVRTKMALAYALDEAAEEENRAVRALGVGAAPGLPAAIEEAGAHVAELERDVERLELAPRAAAIWVELEATREALLTIRDRALEAARRGDAGEVALQLAQWRLMTTRGDALAADFAGYHLRLMDRTVAQLQAERMRALRTTVAALALGLLAAIALAAAVGRAVVQPIVAVSQAAQRILETGRSSAVAGGDRGDEIGTLARSFNTMTERLLAANARLEEADRRKDEFLGMLSHELRNPLAPLRNALYILDRAEPRSEQAERARAVMNRQVAHLTRLVDDLLDVTRIARGKIELRRGPLDVAALVRRSGEDHAPLLRERGHELRIEVADAPLPADGDETRLAQVVGNLLVNAAKFTPPGGRVTLSAARDGGEAVVRVADTGAGIDPELLPRIFEPFTQGKQSLARPEGGLGLGLSLVRGIVELHGGTVEARSAGPGRGSELVVRLPLSRAAGAEAGPGDGEPRLG